jgi:hypothetical protein
MLSYRDFKTILDDYNYIDNPGSNIPELNRGTTANRIRHYNGPKQIIIREGGWHFTWIGDAEFIMNKHRSICEGNAGCDLAMAEKLRNSTRIKEWHLTLIPVIIDRYFPEYIVKNQKKYAALIKKPAFFSAGLVNGWAQFVAILIFCGNGVRYFVYRGKTRLASRIHRGSQKYLLQGDCSWEKKDYSNAAKCYRLYIEKTMRLPEKKKLYTVYLRLVTCEVKSGNYQAAAGYNEQAGILWPQSNAVRLNRLFLERFRE